MGRPTIIAGNWKMHKTISETVQFLNALTPRISGATCKIFLAPPFTAIAAAAKAAQDRAIQIGAQNMSDIDEGAMTGEISARMLKEAGASFVLLGHSERRSHFNETDIHINHKLKRAVAEDLPAILCIGESEAERASGRSTARLIQQLDQALKDLTEEQLKDLLIAYEPVWAIGTGKTATPEIAQETHNEIRAHLAKHFTPAFAEQVPILYGGSVKPTNIDEILEQTDIDGALIGGASLDVESFTQMVNR